MEMAPAVDPRPGAGTGPSEPPETCRRWRRSSVSYLEKSSAGPDHTDGWAPCAIRSNEWEIKSSVDVRTGDDVTGYSGDTLDRTAAPSLVGSVTLSTSAAGVEFARGGERSTSVEWVWYGLINGWEETLAVVACSVHCPLWPGGLF